jgi:ergothioneine biosynthesis protein EgtB
MAAKMACHASRRELLGLQGCSPIYSRIMVEHHPSPAASAASLQDRRTLAQRYAAVRSQSLRLIAGLEPEDMVIQSMPDVSPTKWHLAHTSWFFETFLLEKYAPKYRPFDESYRYLFNSYYEAVGPRHPRVARGMLSRPTAKQVVQYRQHVDQQMALMIASVDDATATALTPLVELGLNHEQQHQELIVTDIKHVLAGQHEMPAIRPAPKPSPSGVASMDFIAFDEGLVEIGHDGTAFAFDNESPRHKTYVAPFRLASRPVSCGEYAAFIADGGYRRAEFWLSDGWAAVNARDWHAPLYWRREGERWTIRTLSGERRIDEREPVAHLSYYEADAYAAWAGKRLPSEAEWELAAGSVTIEGNFLDSDRLHPVADSAHHAPGLRQMFGDVWEWTRSAYLPYPGFRPAEGAIGEYNGKFMSGQMVLRGGSCATPADHIRPTYRNFFPPDARWQFSGLRLAEDA